MGYFQQLLSKKAHCFVMIKKKLYKIKNCKFCHTFSRTPSKFSTAILDKYVSARPTEWSSPTLWDQIWSQTGPSKYRTVTHYIFNQLKVLNIQFVNNEIVILFSLEQAVVCLLITTLFLSCSETKWRQELHLATFINKINKSIIRCYQSRRGHRLCTSQLLMRQIIKNLVKEIS